ncbi:23S rRNA (pseudouridine1915-N3)-methyltransferase [Caloranaerobacter azorensis DSM 13643]|uniref:Ribosomal RNA large subunit methyltransferase H n=1 Tax=Caloranaerobacter azorensis DSM 13643 TaxID=1121264 RepID=A0A1M5WR94_9FIRM|nr:23S rRNA (pseudouridine(1915)-N(3))-methyltransferase RlmH [Caloranaerobacter azorensis]SHH89892.1 23S rRNA (pseudouridine1915-N3)-methyltransferase [Caloranaerobacter azorensis DSM 13643]
MNIKIITTEKIREKFAKEAINEYSKRLSRYCKLKFVEVKDKKQLQKEITDKTYLVLVSIEGNLISSEELANKISNLALTGKSDITFLIIYGEVKNEIKERADYHLAISNMAMDISVLIIIMYEQIYRAYRIINNEPYHK